MFVCIKHKHHITNIKLNLHKMFFELRLRILPDYFTRIVDQYNELMLRIFIQNFY